MKYKFSIAALFFAMAPMTALAQGCNGSGHSEQQASMSCGDGMTLDADANTCIADTTS